MSDKDLSTEELRAYLARTANRSTPHGFEGEIMNTVLTRRPRFTAIGMGLATAAAFAAVGTLTLAAGHGGRPVGHTTAPAAHATATAAPTAPTLEATPVPIAPTFTPPPTPTPRPASHITVSGDKSGTLTNLKVTCNLHEVRADFIRASGILSTTGHQVDIVVYDPASAPIHFAYVEATYFLSPATDPSENLRGTWSGWSTQQSSGVSNFGVATGATIDRVNVEPGTQGSSGDGSVPKTNLQINGSLTCG